MTTITKKVNGFVFTFAVGIEADVDHGAPWGECDGHGPVTDWQCRDHYKGGKHPGELILDNQGRGVYRFYDYAEACKIALRDGWDAKPYNDGSETPRQQAAKAARADFERLRAWCSDEWHYVGVVVTLLDPQGEPTAITESLWGIESDAGEYLEDAAEELAHQIMSQYGKTWGTVQKTTYAPIAAGADQ